MPTTDDVDRWNEHYNATKDAQGEPWTPSAAAWVVLAAIIACLAGIVVVWLMITGGAL